MRPVGGAGGQGERAALHHFFESTMDLLAVLDLTTTPIEVSRSWEELLGWTAEELLEIPLIELVHPDDLEVASDDFGVLLAGGRTRGTDLRLQAKDGTYRWLRGGASADLEAERIYLTLLDIQDHKELEVTLRRQLSFEELVASIATSLICVEPGEVPTVIAEALGELGPAVGAQRAHFLRGSRHPGDTTYLEWYDPDTPQPSHVPHPDPDVQTWWRVALRSGRVLRYEDVEELRPEAPHVVDALREDGVRSIIHIPLPPHRRFWGFLTMVTIDRRVEFSDATTSLLRLAGDCFMTALATGDYASALVDARRELELRNDELERSNEDLERFAYAAAHDLKAPLSRVEMALTAAPPAEGSAGELLEIARRGAARMRGLIEDLLAFASVGRDAGQVALVDLDEVLDQVLVDLEPAIHAAGAVVERSPLPAIEGHRSLLVQLLQNVVGNALKFAHEDATLTVRIESTVEAGEVTVRVADSGIGIPPAEREHVFGVFTRLHPDDQYPGSGIGLATCARVVHHHGGRIWIEDGIGTGIAVCFRLPLTQAGAPAPRSGHPG